MVCDLYCLFGEYMITIVYFGYLISNTRMRYAGGSYENEFTPEMSFLTV